MQQSAQARGMGHPPRTLEVLGFRVWGFRGYVVWGHLHRLLRIPMLCMQFWFLLWKPSVLLRSEAGRAASSVLRGFESAGDVPCLGAGNG